VKRKVNFTRDGLTLVGNLFTPPNFDETGQYPAVIVQGSFTSVKEQMAGTYARKLADQGFVALAFDYSHYGASQGEPRQLESPSEKLADLQAAHAFLSRLSYVRGVGMVGICTSAGNAVELAATEPSLKALAMVAAFLPGPALYTRLYGEDGLAERKARSSRARRKYETTGDLDLVSAYSETDPAAINVGRPGSYDYYLNTTRGNVPEYKNQSALMGLEQFLSFDPISKAKDVIVPTVVVHSDGCAFPEEAKRLYAELRCEKELVWADGTHYNYYDSPQQVDNAAANVARFFKAHMRSAA